MFPDSFALQDCLPSDSVAKQTLTKEKMAFQITEIQRPTLSWSMSLWVIWLCLLEIGRIPKKWGGAVVYLPSRRLILSSLVHTIYTVLMFVRGWKLWIKLGIELFFFICYLQSIQLPWLSLSIQHLQETTLSTKEMWLKGQTGEKNVNKLFFMLFHGVSECYQKPRTSGKDVPDRGTMEEEETVWLILLAGHLKH